MKKARLLLVEEEYIEATKGNELMKRYVESNSNGDDEIASTLKEIRIAKRELQALLKKVNSHAQVSSLIDKKYSLYRNRFILRTGTIPEMELMEKPYVDVSFLGQVEEEVENVVVENGSDEERIEGEENMEGSKGEVNMEGSKGEENTGEDGTDEYDSVSEEDIRSQDEPVNEPVERDMNQEDEMYPDDYDESYDDHYDDNYDDAYNEPYDDDYDDTYDDHYDDVYDNPNPSKKSEEYDIEIDSQNKFTIDFPVRHSHPLEINVFLLHFTYN